MQNHRIIYCLHKLITIAEGMECKQLHHRKGHQHSWDESCLAEKELREIIQEVDEYIETQLMN